MIKLNFDEYKDKVFACWQGKNMGGTLGGPFEGVREKLNLTGFTTTPNEPMPNDDLDLQLAWLIAVEYEGSKRLTAEKLGEYWLSLITHYSNEYGTAIWNMKSGLYPPVSGSYNNDDWKHSNGAWIRTEIWATLAPASPDVAVRLSMEDGKVDHSLGEGTYAAAFIAAIESSAFVVSDINKLIEIGLSYIPENSRVAKTVKLVKTSYEKGLDRDKVRELVLKENEDIGDGWFQAPSNIGYVVLGLLYGQGDFKKSMLYAVNCGDDTDCTAATVGSIMGIIGGTKNMPKDWQDFIGDKITTCGINPNLSVKFPRTITELTERVVNLAPAVLIENCSDVKLTEKENEIDKDIYNKFLALKDFKSRRENVFNIWQDEVIVRAFSNDTENSFTVDLPFATVIITYLDGVRIKDTDEKRIGIRAINRVKAHGNAFHDLTVRVIDLSENVEVDKMATGLKVERYSSLTP